MGTREIPYQDGMKLGFGYDLLRGVTLTSPAVTGSTSGVTGAGGQQVTTHITRIDDLETLHTSLGVSVDAGGSYFGFGGSAKVDFIHECSFTQYSTFLLVSVSVWDSFESYDSPVLSPDAAELMVNNNKTRFRERFGDVFLSGLRKGGEFFAVYVVSGSDETEKEAVATQVNLGFNMLIASADVNTNIKSATDRSHSHLKVDVQVFQAGSIDTTAMSPGEILQRAHDFPNLVKGNLAYPYAMSVADYSSLRLPNDSFNQLQIQAQQDALQDMARKRFAFLTRANDIDYVLAHPDEFETVDATALHKMHDDVMNAVNDLQRKAVACSKDATQCDLPLYDVNNYPLPSRKPGKPLRAPDFAGHRLAEVLAWGSDNNIAIDDNEFEGYLVTYEDQDGHVHQAESPSALTVSSQDPPANTPIPPGASLKVYP